MKLITLNAQNYDDGGNWETRKKMIVNAIVQCNADVIALQEIRFDRSQESTTLTYQNMGEQIVSDLSQYSGYATCAIVYQWAQYYANGSVTQKITTTWEGLGIISRLPIVETGSAFLSMPQNSGDKNHRITQYITVTTGAGNTVHVFNAHFAVYSWCPLCLNSNVTETLEYMNKISTASRVLVGDLNAPPDNEEIQRLKTSGLVDMWPTLHPGEDGFTYPSYPTPNERIDYVWADKGLATSVKEIEIILADPQSGVYASDHLGLAVTLSV
ncbi:MAG: endonuclease/exonuclease/phosphatase family protein [Theionarchaea archaeon]|nr:endonuclease/exonuclease/phosphatase family protein [Theionarchaea archaeon]MBU7021492.1 endonuclease/exonuclease/phosphatase family protein [Theionarchaea archaeon]